jgi:ABC-2 type transport system ATP-binding protein
VDHGKLVALDTPNALKQTVPGSNVIEVQFGNAPGNWEQLLQGFPDVRNVQAQGGHAYRLLSDNSSKTVTELVALALQHQVEVKALSVHNTTLDDVFVYYTGRQLRDQEVSAHIYTGWISGGDR